MTQPNTITLETRGAIEILTLNRPDQRNAVTPDMITDLTGYFSDLHDRPTTRVVILRGNGPEFSAGAELGSDEEQVSRRQTECGRWGRRSGEPCRVDAQRDGPHTCRLEAVLLGDFACQSVRIGDDERRPAQ